MALDESVIRVLDANLNRAREALRVAEDHARFLCDDANAAHELKSLRHELTGLTAELHLTQEARLVARDTPGDVGRDLKTPAELQRTTPDSVARAALARATEALRVISEYAKLSGESAAAAMHAERLRYALYEIEPRLALRGPRRSRLRAARLCVLISDELCVCDGRRRPWLEVAEAALSGGADLLQLREKHLTDAELLSRARALRERTARHCAMLIVNDRPDIARLAGADGVHVGQDDLPVAEARRAAGAGLLVGVSTHTQEQVVRAAAAQPDYVAIGPVFQSRTKPQEHIAGLSAVRAAAAVSNTPSQPAATNAAGFPLLAIGGITPQNAASVFAAGATCVCVCASVIGAPDPERAARSLRASLSEPRP